MNDNQPSEQAPRFSRNDLFYYASLVILFIGITMQFSLSVALIALGAIGVLISIVNSYFMVWYFQRTLKK